MVQRFSVSNVEIDVVYTTKRLADLLIVGFHKFALQERHKIDFSVITADSFDDTADIWALILFGGLVGVISSPSIASKGIL
jgi:hypothetical protein